MVKVAPDWRENERVLDDLGIEAGRRKGDGTSGGRRVWTRTDGPSR